MRRVPEPELMDDAEQAHAYAQADFSEPHNRFIELLRLRLDSNIRGPVLDLGCGPGDICERLALAYPDCLVHGVDGAQAMLQLGEKNARAQGLAHRIHYISGYLPDITLPLESYETIISNSLLHHLKDPMTLWRSILRYSHSNSQIFIMDLLRPETTESASHLVATYAKDEPVILQRDFFNSLLAAYRTEEVKLQLRNCSLGFLNVEAASDRHLIVHGRMPACDPTSA